MAATRVLIIGAGVTGPTLAYFLCHTPTTKFAVTLLERSSNLRLEGQNVDIRGTGMDVLQKMGVEKIVRSSTTEEEGLAFVDSRGQTVAAFPADKTGATQTFTSDVEILRGRLAEILFNRTKNDIEHIFGNTISSLSEGGDKVHVTFNGGLAPRDFEIVVGADGSNSKTRTLLFGEQQCKQWIRRFGVYVAYFAIPRIEIDDRWWRWNHVPGRKCMQTRPSNEGGTKALLMVHSNDERFEKAVGRRSVESKTLMREFMTGTGWQAERLLDGMDKTEDYYYENVAQVRMPKWSKGRVVLVGDAAYCPSPFSGMGTTVALTGAYTLAGELSTSPANPSQAFENYEKRMRPLVNKAQTLAPGTPKLMMPETAWGVAILHYIIAFLSWSGIVNLMMKLGSGPPARAMKIGDYGFGDAEPGKEEKDKTAA